MTARVAGMLLAAGAGRRFGGPKALARFQDQLLVERGAETLRSAGCAPVVVVVGADADNVARHARLGDARLVVNEAWAEGIGSSLRTGLAALAGTNARAVVVTLVDQPLVTAAAVGRLVGTWHGQPALMATYAGRRGHPVLLSAGTWTEVAALAKGDQGARGWLRAHPDQVEPVACDGLGSDDDLDTPDDLTRLESAGPG